MANFDNVLFEVGPHMLLNSSRVVAMMKNEGVGSQRLRRNAKSGYKLLIARRGSYSKAQTLIITDTGYVIDSPYSMTKLNRSYHKAILEYGRMRKDFMELIAEILKGEV